MGGQPWQGAHERGSRVTINAVASRMSSYKLHARAQATKAPMTMRLAMMTALEIRRRIVCTVICGAHAGLLLAPLPEAPAQQRTLGGKAVASKPLCSAHAFRLWFRLLRALHGGAVA